MFTIFECVLTLLLTITPQFSNSSVAYATFRGQCSQHKGLALKFDKTKGVLLIETSSMIYTLSLPTEEGYYDITYRMGKEKVQIIPGRNFPVRIGLKGFI